MVFMEIAASCEQAERLPQLYACFPAHKTHAKHAYRFQCAPVLLDLSARLSDDDDHTTAVAVAEAVPVHRQNGGGLFCAHCM